MSSLNQLGKCICIVLINSSINTEYHGNSFNMVRTGGILELLADDGDDALYAISRPQPSNVPLQTFFIDQKEGVILGGILQKKEQEDIVVNNDFNGGE